MSKVKIIISFLVLLVLSVGGVFYYYTTVLGNAQKWVSHTNSVQINAQIFLMASMDMQRAVRGYLLSGDAKYLEPYNKGSETIYFISNKLKREVSDNDSQINRIQKALDLLDVWSEEYAKPAIEVRKKIASHDYTMSDLMKELRKGRSKAYFDIFRQQEAEFVYDEKILLQEREKDYKSSAKGSHVSLKELKENIKWVKHTNRVLLDSKQLLIYALDMETGMRGYLLSGKEEFLEPYKSAKDSFFKHINYMKKNVSDNNSQVSQLRKMEDHIKEWVKNIVIPMINLRKEIGDIETIEGVFKRASADAGKMKFDNYKMEIDAFIAEEQRLMKIRENKLSSLRYSF